MENRFKLRISRMFRASFGSCRSRNLSDVVEKAVFLPENQQNFHMIEPSSPMHRPFPSICRPKPLQTPDTINRNCIIPAKNLFPRRKVSEACSPFASANPDGRNCPPASPILPLNPFYQFKQRKKGSERNKNKKKKKTTHMKSKHIELFPLSWSSQDMSFGGWWSSSDEEEEEEGREDETDTLFSSKSLSSDSSESRRHRSRRKRHETRRRRAGPWSSEIDLTPMQGRVKDSFAVVKRSSDPYNDFRTSMVEMIVEKQIFAAKDLEQLLQCFLSLNSIHHHRVIVEVFAEIWEALFCNMS
jgi:uncharacterized protein (TIGR01568 family)